MIIEKFKIKINLVDEVDIDNEDKADKQIKKEQHIWFLLLLLVL